MNIPNYLSLARILAIPAMVAVMLTNFQGHDLVACIIFIFASLTDWLDGYLARRRQEITGLGQWMDPMADKLLVTAAFVSLVYLDLAKAWMVTVILGREFYVTVLRSIVHARGLSLPASPLGKVKMVAQVAAILILIYVAYLLVYGAGTLWAWLWLRSMAAF